MPNTAPAMRLTGAVEAPVSPNSPLIIRPNTNVMPSTARPVRVTRPRRTSRYRALRRSSIGISSTWCFTTAYANERGTRNSAMTAPVQTANGSCSTATPFIAA